MKKTTPRQRRARQINILHTNTRQRHSRTQLTRAALLSVGIVAGIVALGVGIHAGFGYLLGKMLYTNPHYVLNEIQIEPRGPFSTRQIRQAAGLELGENLWTLNLRQIAGDIEKLPYVSSARVERRFPDRVIIHIRERVPVVKIVGTNVDLGTRETFYLDRGGIVLKPRENEAVPLLPEVIGLTNAEFEPGTRLDQPRLARALEILDAIDHSPLHTLLDIRSIDLSQQLSISMTTTRDMTITFRPDYIDQQMQRLQQSLDYADAHQQTVRTVDLTPDCNDPITFY